ncbi:leishmanolysin family protein (macronuclear) [Tetrahymena thermophila SB210]|uniref:Leishmanolysin family protein n=1 Tax=Tetrahymena thermophila (strain SB210) TaxID=312017 RepID=I7MJ82_TETTS|nr:leishmanolysin family protein [Tetrahymena thermophila SB210]EAR96056.1 leishmanolysin family protein [Tetrahymena thermophila SB210]|eukprot:XP_001016301.1 leishmanolysin family protein [Tetrahymena thermophila SB210]
MNNKKLFLIFALAIIQLACFYAHQEDVFDESLFPTIDTTDFSEEGRNLQQAQERPFKITYDISYFNSLKDNPSDVLFKQKVEQVMKISVDYFSNLLKFIPRGKGQMKWTLERLICGGGNLLARIPEQDKTEDKDSDLHIYLVYVNEPLQEYVAYAGICRELPGSGTTHAQITFNQAWFNKQDLSNHKIFLNMQGSVFHEIIHVLGFTEKSYSNWIDSTTKQNHKKVTIQQIVRGYKVKFIQTPYVKKAAQEFFGCPTLPGMPLENQGSAGSAGSHWESTVVSDEIMKSTVIKTNFYLSVFTIALLKDTGFYSQVNDSMADQYFYGKDAGCDFVLQECNSTNNKNEFCSKESEKPENQCDFYGNGVSNCESGKFLDNNCMQRVVDDRGYCFDPVKNSKSSTLYTNYYGQYFGENSKCFMSTLVQKIVGSTYELQGSCYKYECIEQSNMLKVWVGNESAICSKNGEKLTFNKYNGYLLCPEKIDQFCQFKKFCPNYCSSNGYCLNGNCVCLKGYSGKSCEKQN